MLRFQDLTRSCALFGAVFVLALPSAWAGNLVGNPGFESGLATPWVLQAGPNHPWTITSGTAHSGTFYISGGCVGSSCMDHTTGDLLFQDLTTSIGATYTLSFWAFDDGVPSELQALWGGTTVLDLGGASATGYGTPGVYSLYP